MWQKPWKDLSKKNSNYYIPTQAKGISNYLGKQQKVCIKYYDFNDTMPFKVKDASNGYPVIPFGPKGGKYFSNLTKKLIKTKPDNVDLIFEEIDQCKRYWYGQKDLRDIVVLWQPNGSH